MINLQSSTEEFIQSSKTSINTDASAGTNVSITLENNIGFSQYDYVVIGIPGTEKAEIQSIASAISGNTNITVGTLKFTHKKGEPVTKYAYNQRKFYGCITIDGLYSELTSEGSPKDIQVDNPTGTSLEYTGTTYNYFKSTYFNSHSGVETDLNDSVAIAGDQSTRYTTISKIRIQTNLTNNPFITDGMIDVYRTRAENEVKSIIMFRYTLPLVEIPAIIENCCTLLAAGYMDYKEFGRDGEGVKWLGEARGILNSIKKGTQRLIGMDEQELPTITTANTVQGYPDGVDNKNGPIRMFTSKQRF